MPYRLSFEEHTEMGTHSSHSAGIRAAFDSTARSLGFQTQPVLALRVSVTGVSSGGAALLTSDTEDGLRPVCVHYNPKGRVRVSC